jgi:Mn2+/Fe2+ NRAMP family transporter
MGAVGNLLFPAIPAFSFSILFTLLILYSVIFWSYHKIAMILKWLCISLISYIIIPFLIGVDWLQVLKDTVVPSFTPSKAYFITLVGILGTTISPYLFFWQASQEIEEQKRHKAKPLCITPKDAGPELKRIRVDTLTGMAFSSIVSLAIVFATAATLHANGVLDIGTSAQAAEALRPIAGNFAFALFSLGIIGTGLLAVPVLAGSAAYAVTEMFGIASSLDAKPTKARLFYGTIAVTTMLGVSLQYVGIDPARALYWAAVVNGVLAAPLMVMMMLIVRNPRAMGRLTLGPRATITGWFATLVMAGATIIFFATL